MIRGGWSNLRKNPPAAALGAKSERARVCRIHRNPQANGQLPFQVGRDEGNQVGPLKIGDQGPNLPEKTRPLQQFPGEGLVGGRVEG